MEWHNKPVPEAASRQVCIEDLIYIERLAEKEKTAGGLFLGAKAEKKMRVGRVVATPGPGLTLECGIVDDVLNGEVKVGDLVIVREAYGIGPRDEEYTGKSASRPSL